MLALGIAAVAAAVGGPAAASDPDPSAAGGLAFFEAPAIDKVACVRRCASSRRVQGGSVVRLHGRALSDVTEATFHGEAGPDDDVTARARPRNPRRALLRVPRRAVSGPVSVRTEADLTSPASDPIDILPALPPAVLSRKGHVFPVRGRHRYGGAGARFGSGRGGRAHQGQDVFARCGTPLVAARGGRVRARAFHAAAGHYIVIAGAGTGSDYAYMHLTSRSPFRAGDRVRTGQRIGSVGESGNAHGCHLHFELWSAPGWYRGGRPIDPLPALKAWARRS